MSRFNVKCDADFDFVVNIIIVNIIHHHHHHRHQAKSIAIQSVFKINHRQHRQHHLYNKIPSKSSSLSFAVVVQMLPLLVVYVVQLIHHYLFFLDSSILHRIYRHPCCTVLVPRTSFSWKRYLAKQSKSWSTIYIGNSRYISRYYREVYREIPIYPIQ